MANSTSAKGNNISPPYTVGIGNAHLSNADDAGSLATRRNTLDALNAQRTEKPAVNKHGSYSSSYKEAPGNLAEVPKKSGPGTYARNFFKKNSK